MSFYGSRITLPSHHSNINNIVQLPYNDKERIVGFMHARFLENKMYTWAGHVLLYVLNYKDMSNTKHPSSKTSILCDDDYDYYQTPSVRALIDRIWFRLNGYIGKLDQTICVMGESGSGKTYSTYLVIKAISKKEDDNLEGDRILRQVWASVPLLSAFGSASTHLNNTSTRFAKLLRLQYNNGFLQGAFIETYLLEKTRVANIREGEGNFHIFRQLLDSLDEDTLASLTLSKLVNYRIAPRVGLKSTFSETVKSMDLLHITEFNRILKVLAIILNLGNVEFMQNVPLEHPSHGDCNQVGRFVATPETQEFLEHVATLLHVRTIKLLELLCTSQLSTKGPNNKDIVYKSTCTDIEKCRERRDSIMKHLYDKLFNWLVNTINLRVFFGDAQQHINILDFYGFENFEHNSFEQLCINYVNERIHYYFTKQFLLGHREELLLDGCEVDNFDDDCYIERLALLDGPVSIFEILNQGGKVKHFKDDSDLNRNLCHTFRSNKHFFVTDELDTYFCIRHYAGVVKYDTRTMINKNRDRIPNDILMFLKSSGFDFIKVLIQHDNIQTVGASQPTVLKYFKSYFDQLEIIFEKADVHYIKCLKPNGFQIPDFFDTDYFAQQLWANSIFDILKLSFQNYWIKLKVDGFIKRIGPPVFEALKTPLTDFLHVGKCNIYLSELSFAVFYRFKQIHMNNAARIVQKCWLRHFCKRHKAACTIQKFVRTRLLNRKKHYKRVGGVSKEDSDDQSQSFCVRANMRRKIEEYLEQNRVEINFEGEPISLRLEKIYHQLNIPKFKRFRYVSENLVSYVNPIHEDPTGLSDVFHSNYIYQKLPI